MSFAPLAFKLFYAARQNAVLRRSPFQWSDRVSGSVSILPNVLTVKLRVIYTMASFQVAAAPPVSRGDMATALADMEELGRATRRVFGDAYPQTIEVQGRIARYRKTFEELTGPREPVATNPEA